MRPKNLNGHLGVPLGLLHVLRNGGVGAPLRIEHPRYPSRERERCSGDMIEIVRRLIAMYTERGGSPPQGLRNFAQEIGLDEGGDSEDG